MSTVHTPADCKGGVAGSVSVGLINKHQFIAGMREPGAQQLLKEPKHLESVGLLVDTNICIPCNKQA